ncbi:hypothetical protein [Aquabacterium sp.]|uniref:hypothetical protein n=1 Tax=Aquabacterium sp. TaxID=1872578 RepID=UPI001983C4CB|nr:hypothetical protein [Aquabacterium sp.]MBC7699742.1 hypothetical protein [Aquabacterium sp.]
MPYALLTTDGQISSLHRDPQAGADFLASEDSRVRAFLGGGGGGDDQPARQFASLDADLVRVLEDLIDALIQRNVLMVTDLPLEAQQKLFNRKNVRDQMKNYSLQLFGSEPLGAKVAEVVSTDLGDTL